MKSSSEFPALRDFSRGYFHEDCIDEYGSMEAAARQFVKDADREQRKVVAHEWAEFLKSFSSVEKINEAMRAMGSACRFADLDEVEKVTRALR
ncbi:MAG TPA: contact-dependent growth inhibition system immunity protein [Terriglobales bacterium]|jgi:hypothetical protein|nr:contact-dependent growth inhibition system immunity protein [Terriglobales bacterium]